MTISTTPLIPRNVLFGNPVKSSPQISPDGKRLAYLAPVENALNVWVGSLDGDDYQPVTEDKERGIRFYFWAADNRHIGYIQDIGGDENWHLYLTNIETRETRDLTPFPNIQARVARRDKHFPSELLIELNKEDPRVHDVYHLDLLSGDVQLVAKNPGNIASWVIDTQLKVRGAVTALPDGGNELLVREHEESEWRTLITWTTEDAQTSGPVSFTLDGNGLYLLDSRNANASRLMKLALANEELSVLAEDPHYDVENILVHPDTYEIQAVTFNRDRVEWAVLDVSLQEDFKRLGKLHAGDFFILSRTNDDQTWLVGYVVDDGPLAYYVYDRSTKNGRFLFTNQPKLNEYLLASMQPVTFQARDGLTLHGYLTLPKGKSPTSLPLVLNVHGGPWARDSWGYRAEAQWFANRGYACLQVNYRGSTGYGKDFLNAGNKEWGAKMHDDLVDAVHWAIEQGIADPKKVAIYGGSYGGYAALVGAAFTPDLFCCAVDIVGPSNLLTLIKTIPPYWSTFLATFHMRVGNPDTEEEFLKSRSPLFKADQIKIPLLIAQGANDPRVKQNESEQIVAAMKEKGINYEYMLFPDEGHGFAKPENRIKFYAAAEKFLAKWLGGRYEETEEGA